MKKAELPTGNKFGYSLLELLITLSVVTVTAVYIFPSFFNSADFLNEVANRYRATVVLNNAFSKRILDYRSDGYFPEAALKSREMMTLEYSVETDAEKVDLYHNVYKVVGSARWKDKHNHVYSKSIYAA